MALRPALVLIGAVAACFTAGWSVGFTAKANPAATAQAKKAADPAAAQPKAAAADDTFQKKILPFLKAYCIDCHNAEKVSGGLQLDGYQSEAHARKNRKDWGAVQHALAANDMPPPKRKQPTKEERQFVIEWIENTLTKVDCGATAPRDPGRVTIRRLNRAEYNNTIRDLCGVDFKPAEDFPADDVGYGFDNIGDVLSLQPVVFEKYMAAADKILAAALKVDPVPQKDQQTFRPQQISTVPRSAKSRTFNANGRQVDRIVFASEGAATLPQNQNFPAEGEYVLRFRGWGTKVGGEFPKVVVRVDGKDVETFTVEAEAGKAKAYETKPTKFAAGEKRVAVAFTNPFEDKASNTSREFGLETIEVEGPFNPVPPPVSDSVKLLIGGRPDPAARPADARAAAEKALAAFATRAYRRPVKPDEVARLLRLFDLAAKQGEPFEAAVRLPMKAVLVSPHFLYRIEEDPKNPDDAKLIGEFELATRLSYFLWSSMPDAELFALAQKGELRKPGVLESQVKRMLKDPKAKALSENFAAQWLQLGLLKPLSPDKGYFPNWDENLRAAMAGEALAYFEHVVNTDRSVLEFLDSDYTFVNGRLARHYGIEDVFGLEFQKVSLADGRRGGVVTMGSTLTLTSNPTRTSPVKRGKWILENVLGTPPPPPAPDVPELPPTGQLKGTLRQQMEQHRENPSCAVCHAKLDPLGFGLENFDAVGAWRTKDNKQEIDPSGVLPGGEKFSGPAELRKVLLGKADLFRRCFAEKLMTFGLGRGLEYYDKCALDSVVAAGKADGDKFSSIVLAIVKSDPFQKRKGKRSE